MIIIHNEEVDVLAEVFGQQRPLTEQELKTLRDLMGRVWEDKDTRQHLQAQATPKR